MDESALRGEGKRRLAELAGEIARVDAELRRVRELAGQLREHHRGAAEALRRAGRAPTPGPYADAYHDALTEAFLAHALEGE